MRFCCHRYGCGFPTLIAIITMFFAGAIAFPYQSIISTLILTAIIILAIFITLATSKLLSKTILKGMPSSFVLELPPYRRPQIGKVIVRSIFDRTLFVLGRAVAVAAPAGLIIWIFSNIFVNGSSVLSYCSNFLDPFARLIGLDGVILMAFILGFSANEIVMPIIIHYADKVKPWNNPQGAFADEWWSIARKTQFYKN